MIGLTYHQKENIKCLIHPSDITNANPLFQRKNKDQSCCQIDYIIQNNFGTCYLCKITTHVIDEIKQKIYSLNLPKHISLRPILIHVNGVDEKVQKSNFFSSIIDFNDLL